MPTTTLHLRAAGMTRGSRAIFRDIELVVRQSEKLALLGPSGVGKSSLLQAVAGLAPLTSGAVVVDGHKVSGPVPAVTMMLQRPALLPWATARENVALGLRFAGVFRRDRSAAERRVIEMLARVGLADRLDAIPSELSGGEQQRVALARALAPSPRVLLLDEPFSSLDPQTRETLREDVRRLTTDNGVTVLLVTHDIADATALCRRIVRLAGRPATVVSDEVIADPQPSAAQPLSSAA